jgi:hypothetical protein
MIFKKKTPIGLTGSLIPSPEDKRDYLLSNFIPPIKRYPEAIPRLFDLDILDQKTEPSCVGFSCAGIKQFNELKEKVYKVFDGSWLYKECKKIDNWNGQGTYLRVGLEILRNTGIKPINETDPSPYKIAAYALVDDNSFEGIKKAITLYGTVLAGFHGSNQGWCSEIVRPPKAGETQWGHAVFLVGYEKNYLIGQNSWGTRSHNQGLFKVPADYLPFESWTIILDKVNTPSTATTGWVARTFLINNVTTANLNVREKPTTTSKVIKILPLGTKVIPTGTNDVLANNHWWKEITI